MAAILRKRWGAKAEIARVNKIGRSSVSNWLAGRAKGARVEKAIRDYVRRIGL